MTAADQEFILLRLQKIRKINEHLQFPCTNKIALVLFFVIQNSVVALIVALS